jgi:ribosome-interacting GTPase 1
MPTNLPPEAQEAERRWRAATTSEEKITNLEEFLSLIPKHKGTDHLRADLRRKLSKLKSAAQARKKTTRVVSPYHIDPEGAGQVAVIGPPNVGKSALVDVLTKATPEVSAAPYTTWGPTPGMMYYENVQIQLIDTPPLNPEYVEPEMMNLLRRVDLILLVLDLQADPFDQLEQSLALLESYRMVPLYRASEYRDQERVQFVLLQVLVNKCDDDAAQEDFDVFCELLGPEACPMLPVSATTGRGLEALRRSVYDLLEVMRIYSKAPGREPDLSSPFVMERGGTVEEFARKIHQDFYQNLKSARVWGHGVHDGQLVGRDHVLHDEDIVELRI